MGALIIWGLGMNVWFVIITFCAEQGYSSPVYGVMVIYVPVWILKTGKNWHRETSEQTTSWIYGTMASGFSEETALQTVQNV